MNSVKIADQDIKLLGRLRPRGRGKTTKAELEAHRDEIIDVKAKTEEKKANLDNKRRAQEELEIRLVRKKKS